MSKIKVVKSKENPEPTQVLAEAIIKISESMERLSKTSGLNQKALIILIQAHCETVWISGTRKKPSQGEIKVILESMRTLKGWYLRK